MSFSLINFILSHDRITQPATRIPPFKYWLRAVKQLYESYWEKPALRSLMTVIWPVYYCFLVPLSAGEKPTNQQISSETLYLSVNTEYSFIDKTNQDPACVESLVVPLLIIAETNQSTLAAVPEAFDTQ